MLQKGKDMSSRGFHISLTIVVFFIACWMGFSVALQKPLWGDEMYSEQTHIKACSYLKIISGTIGEGEKAPIYFCTQKLIDQIFSLNFPDHVTGNLYKDKRAQIICRISAVLAITLIFYYFTRTIGFWAGASGLLIILSTFMVWAYWAEDRVYPFWFLGTTIQALVVLWASQYKPKELTVLSWLLSANILLALMTPTCVLQIVAVMIWMFLTGFRKISDYFVVCAVPFGIVFFYYHQMQVVNGPLVFFFKFPWYKVFTANIPLERIVVLVIAGAYLCLRWLRLRATQDHQGNLNCLSFLYIICVAGAGLLLEFKIKSGHNIAGWSMEGRYFIFLAPIGIIAMTFIFTRLMQLTRSWKIKTALVLALIFLTVPRIWRYTHFSYITMSPVGEIR